MKFWLLIAVIAIPLCTAHPAELTEDTAAQLEDTATQFEKDTANRLEVDTATQLEKDPDSPFEGETASQFEEDTVTGLEKEATETRSRRIPNYARMNFRTPKRVISFPRAHGICTGPGGKFAIVAWERRMSIFSECGDVLHVARPPPGARSFADCLFTPNGLLVADYHGRKIYKYSTTGVYQGVFATGHNFISMVHDNNYLYTSIHRNEIYVFNLRNHGLVRKFRTQHTQNRGVALDRANNVFIAMWGNTVEAYTRTGQRVKKSSYCDELNNGFGIYIDAANNVIIADRRRPSEVLVYDSKGFLVQRLTGFRDALDVEVDTKGNLWVVDHNTGKAYKF